MSPTVHQVALKVVFLGRRDLSSEQRAILASEAKFLRMVGGWRALRCAGIKMKAARCLCREQENLRPCLRGVA